MTDLEKQIEELTYEQKQALLAQLFKQTVGPQPIDHPLYHALPLSLPSGLGDKVPSGVFATLQATPHELFKPVKLLILESHLTREVVDYETTFAERVITTGPWYSRKKEILREPQDRIGKTRIEKYSVSRSSWSVHGLFVGSRSQLSTGKLNGSAFSPDSQVRFRDDGPSDPHLMITVQVKNESSIAAEPMFVVLGELVKPEVEAKDLATVAG